MALFGLSLSFTVGFPLAEIALHTSEKGARVSFLVSPLKSLVSMVPQPNDTRTRPANWVCNSTILSTSSPSEKMTSFWVGSSPRDVHQLIAVCAPVAGSPLSTLIPVQPASSRGRV